MAVNAAEWNRRWRTTFRKISPEEFAREYSKKARGPPSPAGPVFVFEDDDVSRPQAGE